MNKISDVLKYLRKSSGLTQKQLAKETGLSLSSIISYENGLREPNSKAMVILEKYFKVSGEYLRGELDNKSFKENVIKVSNIIDSYYELFSEFKELFYITNQHNQFIAVELLNTNMKYILKNITRDKAIHNSLPEQFEKIYFILSMLNPVGIDELIKRGEEMTQIKKYTCDNNNK